MYRCINIKNILGLKLVPAVARRYLEDRLIHGDRFSSAEQLADYLYITMRPLNQEVFRVLLLDAEHRVTSAEDLFSGTLNQSAVYPREVVSKALAAGASAVVCAHNHPTGSPKPSEADRAVTRKLYYACRGVDLKLLDHVVVGLKERP